MKNYAVLILIVVGVIGSSTSIISASPINIFGLSWSQEPIVSAVRQMSYDCSEEAPWGETACTQGTKEIRIFKDKKIIFSCSVFNGCGYSLEEIAQSVVKAGVIKELKFETELVTFGNYSYYVEKYCGRGKEGDVLCAVKDRSLTGKDILRIELLKGQFGKGGMKFN